MELGNLFFGNSRGKYPLEDRNLVHSEEWQTLIKLTDFTYKKFTLEKDGEIIFELNPYYWGECDCGADKENAKKENQIINKYLSKSERKVYFQHEYYCDNNCPADRYSFEIDNIEKTNEELLPYCICGNIAKNINLEKQKQKILPKTRIMEQEILENVIAKEMVKGNLKEGHSIEFYMDGNQIKYKIIN